LLRKNVSKLPKQVDYNKQVKTWLKSKRCHTLNVIIRYWPERQKQHNAYTKQGQKISVSTFCTLPAPRPTPLQHVESNSTLRKSIGQIRLDCIYIYKGTRRWIDKVKHNQLPAKICDRFYRIVLLILKD